MWDFPTPANRHTVCPTLRAQEWQGQNNDLPGPIPAKRVKFHQNHSVSAGTRKLQNSNITLN